MSNLTWVEKGINALRNFKREIKRIASFNYPTGWDYTKKEFTVQELFRLIEATGKVVIIEKENVGRKAVRFNVTIADPWSHLSPEEIAENNVNEFSEHFVKELDSLKSDVTVSIYTGLSVIVDGVAYPDSIRNIKHGTYDSANKKLYVTQQFSFSEVVIPTIAEYRKLAEGKLLQADVELTKAIPHGYTGKQAVDEVIRNWGRL